jgi:hypothetical protein
VRSFSLLAGSPDTLVPFPFPSYPLSRLPNRLPPSSPIHLPPLILIPHIRIPLLRRAVVQPPAAHSASSLRSTLEKGPVGNGGDTQRAPSAADQPPIRAFVKLEPARRTGEEALELVSEHFWTRGAVPRGDVFLAGHLLLVCVQGSQSRSLYVVLSVVVVIERIQCII